MPNKKKASKKSKHEMKAPQDVNPNIGELKPRQDQPADPRGTSALLYLALQAGPDQIIKAQAALADAVRGKGNPDVLPLQRSIEYLALTLAISELEHRIVTLISSFQSNPAKQTAEAVQSLEFAHEHLRYAAASISYVDLLTLPHP